MVLAALCERISSALLGSEKAPELQGSSMSTGVGAARRPAQRSATATVVPFATRAQWSAGSNPHSLSPRQMVQLSARLQASGQLAAEDSLLLAVPPELHPDYPATIGTMEGSLAPADRPRDQLAVWEARLAFALAHTPDDRERIARIGRILKALRPLAAG